MTTATLFFFLIRYFLNLHSKCYPLSRSPPETLYSILPSPASMRMLTHTLPPPGSHIPLYWGIEPSQDHGPLLPLMTDWASQETAISGFCQQNLVGIGNSVRVWWLYMDWISRWGSLWMLIPSVSALNFVSVPPSMGILFPLLRKILSFWGNIHLSVSAYHICSSVIRLPHSR